ncbi:unnamed protein product, partial [marine sediment metagenome]
SDRLGIINPVEAYRISFLGFLAAAILGLISALFLRETLSHQLSRRTPKAM